MYTLTFITGPNGSSKSTLARMVKYLAASETIVAIDSSTCLKNSRKQGTDAGNKLIQLNEEQKAGKILHFAPVVESVLENMVWIHKYRNTIHNVLVPGCPRADGEVKEWLRRKYVSFRVLSIDCTDTEVAFGVQERIRKGEIREDDGPKEIQTRLEEYHTKTKTAIDAVPKYLLKHTQRSKPFEDRMRDLIEIMEIPDRVKEKWNRRLNEPSHPIHAKIREELAGKKKLPAPHNVIPLISAGSSVTEKNLVYA